MKLVTKVKEAYERADRVNAIKAMKKADRTEEQVAELKQWRKEEWRNTGIIIAAASAFVAYESHKNKEI